MRVSWFKSVERGPSMAQIKGSADEPTSPLPRTPYVWRRQPPLCCASWTLSTPRSAHTALRRSEEHTSELQSRQYLVCRLLLEKKTITIYTRPHAYHQATSHHVSMQNLRHLLACLTIVFHCYRMCTCTRFCLS